MLVALVDYGAGNLASVVKGLGAVGAEVVLAATPRDLDGAPAVVIPGVGHFDATRRLGDEWRQAVRAHIDAGASVLGICLGMQWLFDGSDEAPALPGLGIFPGRCVRFQEKTSGVFFAPDHNPQQNTENPARRVSLLPKKTPDVFSGASEVKVPHVGWNTLDFRDHPGSKDQGLLKGIAPGSYAYFTHSYAAPVTDDTMATTTHGIRFASVVARGRVYGAQWHPEKSGETGLQLLRNFIALAAEAR